MFLFQHSRGSLRTIESTFSSALALFLDYATILISVDLPSLRRCRQNTPVTVGPTPKPNSQV